jgi:hypothetical protein
MFSLIALYFTYRGQAAATAAPVATSTPVRAVNDSNAAPVARAA